MCYNNFITARDYIERWRMNVYTFEYEDGWRKDYIANSIEEALAYFIKDNPTIFITSVRYLEQDSMWACHVGTRTIYIKEQAIHTGAL